jgi:hypothetical protein
MTAFKYAKMCAKWKQFAFRSFRRENSNKSRSLRDVNLAEEKNSHNPLYQIKAWQSDSIL